MSEILKTLLASPLSTTAKIGIFCVLTVGYYGNTMLIDIKGDIATIKQAQSDDHAVIQTISNILIGNNLQLTRGEENDHRTTGN